jgi:hypothetical protein
MIAQFDVLLMWFEVKKYNCVHAGQHKMVAKVSEDYQKDG